MARAFILVNCDLHKKELVSEKLKDVPGVDQAEKVFGAYDCLVKTDKLESNEIQKLITNGIRNIDSVRSTVTLYEE